MPRYRYRPADNRTPVSDPVFGHLSWDGVYDDPRCADDPRFEPIREKARKGSKADHAPGSNDTAAASTEPPAEPADASKPGRS